MLRKPGPAISTAATPSVSRQARARAPRRTRAGWCRPSSPAACATFVAQSPCSRWRGRSRCTVAGIAAGSRANVPSSTACTRAAVRASASWSGVTGEGYRARQAAFRAAARGPIIVGRHANQAATSSTPRQPSSTTNGRVHAPGRLVQQADADRPETAITYPSALHHARERDGGARPCALRSPMSASSTGNDDGPMPEQHHPHRRAVRGRRPAARRSRPPSRTRTATTSGYGLRMRCASTGPNSDIGARGPRTPRASGRPRRRGRPASASSVGSHANPT